MGSPFLKKLRKANENWSKAKERAGESTGFTEVPDGRYLARLQEAEVGESQSSGRLQVAWKYKIEDGEYENQTLRDFDGLESEDNLMYLARKLNKYGIEVPDSLEEIDEILTELTKAKPLVRVRLKTKGEYQNLYIDKIFESDEDDEEDDDEAPGEHRATPVAAAKPAKKAKPAPAPVTEDDEEEDDEEEDEPPSKKKSKFKKDEEEDDVEEEEEEEEEVEIGVGTHVNARHKARLISGVIMKIAPDGETVTIKDEDDELHKGIPVSALSVAESAEEEEEEEEELAPRAKVLKKKGSLKA